MPVDIINGDIFTSKCEMLVCPVNCIGIMGAGLARKFASRFPDTERMYKELCKGNLIQVGGNLWVSQHYPQKILFFPTKDHWKRPSELCYIEDGLKRFTEQLYNMGINSVAFPPLGCGLGGLRVKDVMPVMLKYLSSLPIKTEIYFYDVPKEEIIPYIEEWCNMYNE